MLFQVLSATLMVGREGTKGTSLAVNTKGNQKIDGDGGTANGLRVSGGSSVNAVYIEGGFICEWSNRYWLERKACR